MGIGIAATLEVARKLVAYLRAVDKSGKPFGSPPAGADRKGGNEGGLKPNAEPTSGKGNFPARAARRDERDARTVLAVKGSLRRAKNRRALDGSGPFRRQHHCDGRLRRENYPDSRRSVDKQQWISDSPAVSRVVRTARGSLVLPMLPIWSVSRPAGLPQFKFRGRRYAVPANGCLVPLMRWPNT